MPVAEYRAWLAYYGDEMFGDVRADLRAGVVASVIARTMGSKRNAKPLDFMPIVKAAMERDEKEMTIVNRVAVMRQTFETNLGTMRVRRVKLSRG